MAEAVERVGTPHDDLGFDETRLGEVACTFVDLRGFTKLALALPPQQTVRILQAVIVAANEHYRGFGGTVLDYTDGAMAIFERDAMGDAVWDALRSTAFILSDIRIVVNEDLKLSEDLTVRAAAGLESGEVCWARLGDRFSSQVKPISGVSFLAGKNSTSQDTAAWQALMGKRISAFVPEHHKKAGPDYDFQFKGQQYEEPRWYFDWEAYLQDFARSEPELRRTFSRLASVAATSVPVPETRTSDGRSLRDAPYA
jgi:hypothetical protein